MEVQKVAVIGSGVMGEGICQVFAQRGFSVVLYDTQQDLVDSCTRRIKKHIAKAIEKGEITRDAQPLILEKIKATIDLNDIIGVDVVIECIVENLEIKQEVLKQVGQICDPQTIIATNTSSLSITELAAASGRPEKFIGMHFFNPAQVMNLIEVIPALQTSIDTVDVIMELSKKIDKKPIRVNEGPGFVVNRILIPAINEACFIIMEGLATVKDIDIAMRLGAGWPMGPFALADLVGLDTGLEVANIFYRETGDPKYRPAPILKQYVRAGWLGRKAGRGFYDYSQHKRSSWCS